MDTQPLFGETRRRVSRLTLRGGGGGGGGEGRVVVLWTEWCMRPCANSNVSGGWSWGCDICRQALSLLLLRV